MREKKKTLVPYVAIRDGKAVSFDPQVLRWRLSKKKKVQWSKPSKRTQWEEKKLKNIFFTEE